MKRISDGQIKNVLDKINCCSLKIYDCVNSIRFALPFLEEIELIANQKMEGHYVGLVNIVDQMSKLILAENDTIMQHSDVISLLKEDLGITD